MGMLRIHCDQCGGAWEVYGRDNWHDRNARTCPHCGHKIERQTWEGQILPAFGAMMDANRELIKIRADHGPLFTVDYLEDSVFQGVTMRDLYDRLEGLEDTLGNMLLGVTDQARTEGILDMMDSLMADHIQQGATHE